MRALTFSILLTAGLLGGCGQKGPLYLPEEPAAAPAAEAPADDNTKAKD